MSEEIERIANHIIQLEERAERAEGLLERITSARAYSYTGSGQDDHQGWVWGLDNGSGDSCG